MTVIDPEQQPQILLIDDDQKLTRLLSGFLQAQGFAVTVAHDGAQGLQRAKEAAWDRVILDVMLPRIDGFEVLTQLRRHSQIPVLMLTGRGGEDDMVAGLEGGADEYVAKTASSRELVTRIRALLRRAVIAGSDFPESDNVLDAEAVFGTLRIVPAARAIYVDGESVHLTNVEYELLVSLARHPGQVRSQPLVAADAAMSPDDAKDSDFRDTLEWREKTGTWTLLIESRNKDRSWSEFARYTLVRS